MSVHFRNTNSKDSENLDSKRVMQPTNANFAAGVAVVFSSNTDENQVAVADEKIPYAFLRQDVKVPAAGEQIPTFQSNILGLYKNETAATLSCSLVRNKDGLIMNTDTIGASITNLIVPTMPDGTKLVLKAGLWELESAYPGKPVAGQMTINKIGSTDPFITQDFPLGYITVVCKA